MKKLIIGMFIGIALSLTVGVYASNTVQTYLFPAKFVFNGHQTDVPADYTILNYQGHAYAPIRFISEIKGDFVGYDNDTETIKINYFPSNTTILTDKVFPRFHVGNIKAEYVNGKTKISGLMSVDLNGSGQPIQSHQVGFSLNFMNDKNEKIGMYSDGSNGHNDKDIMDGEIRYFEGTIDGDISKFAAVSLNTEMFDYIKGD